MWACHAQALLADFDFEYLHTLSDPFRTLQTMLLTKLLSTHAQDEFYLSGPQTDWISVRGPLLAPHRSLSCSLDGGVCSQQEPEFCMSHLGHQQLKCQA